MNKSSKGEIKIEQLLRNGGIKYKREVEFNDLKGSKAPLRFDFGIYEKGKLILLLEYDGRQHYEFVPYFHKS